MKVDGMSGPLARMGDVRNAYNIWVGETERRRSLRRPRYRWGDNIRIVLRQRMWEGVE
jgi:hypothetical protein